MPTRSSRRCRAANPLQLLYAMHPRLLLSVQNVNLPCMLLIAKLYSAKLYSPLALAFHRCFHVSIYHT